MHFSEIQKKKEEFALKKLKSINNIKIDLDFLEEMKKFYLSGQLYEKAAMVREIEKNLKECKDKLEQFVID